MEGYKEPEGINEQEVVNVLDSKGIEDPEVKALLEKYVDQCQAESNAEAKSDPENPEASNRANIKAQIKIAILLSKTEKYKTEAKESFEDAYNAASQNESTHDLAEQIDSLISELDA